MTNISFEAIFLILNYLIDSILVQDDHLRYDIFKTEELRTGGGGTQI